MINIIFNSLCPFCNKQLTAFYNNPEIFQCLYCEHTVEFHYKSHKLCFIKVGIDNYHQNNNTTYISNMYIYYIYIVDIDKKTFQYNWSDPAPMSDFDSLQEMIDVIDTILLFS